MKTALVLLLLSAAVVGAADNSLAFDLGNSVRLNLILVKQGSYMQGSPSSEAKREDDEMHRQATLTRDFYMGNAPVTRAQFARFIAETSYRTEAEIGTSGGFGWNGSALAQQRQYNWRNPGFPQTDDHPVTIVSYADAEKFCQWLRRKTGRNFQLPTEAEWEYACRAGTTTAWFNGDDESKAAEIAWYKPVSGNTTHPVLSRQANAWGFHIGGNVYEWCRDWYGPYAAGPMTNPFQTNPNLSDKPRRVLRGGSWLSEVQHTRSAARYRNTPGSRNADNGFRVMTYDLAAPAPAATPAVALERQAGDATRMPPRASASPPSNPQPMPIPNHVRTSSSFGISLVPIFFFLFVLVFLIILVGFVRTAFKKLHTPSFPNTRVSNASAQPSSDGFWLHHDAAAIGSVVNYKYYAGSQMHEGQVVYQPGADGRQFVYTGLAPASIIILDALMTDDDAPPIISSLSDRRRSRSDSDSSHFHNSGFPSAY